MAIEHYIQSFATNATVSKAQLFRLLEMQFLRADKDHDGQLDSEELAYFVYCVSTPERDQR